MNSNMKRNLSFVLMSVFALGLFLPVQAQTISTQYVSTGCTQLTAALSYGKYDYSTGGQVTALQNFLRVHGYLNVSATGYFGPLTREGVKSFQARSMITADGIVGPQTRAFIFAADCGGNPVPPVSVAPVINGLSSATAAIGSTVTVYGSGFTNNSAVHFGNGGITSTLVNSTGTSLSFAIPAYMGPYCKPNMACIAIAYAVSNGSYPISIENPNGAISNTVQFTVSGSPVLPYIQNQ